jgi:hypothetical protein
MLCGGLVSRWGWWTCGRSQGAVGACNDITSAAEFCLAPRNNIETLKYLSVNEADFVYQSLMALQHLPCCYPKNMPWLGIHSLIKSKGIVLEGGGGSASLLWVCHQALLRVVLERSQVRLEPMGVLAWPV